MRTETYTCNVCGNQMPEHNLTLFHNFSWCVKGYSFRLQAGKITFEFNTTNFHICKKCFTEGLIEELQNQLKEL